MIIYLPIFAFLILLGMRQIAPDLIRFQMSSFLRFAKIMLWVTLLRAVSLHLQGFRFDLDSMISTLTSFGFLKLFLVFWEDTFFTLPILFWAHKGLSKWALIPYTVCASIVFASGHIYQSYTWAALTLIYIPFLSYYYGRRVGLGTVMACHILYDIATVFIVRSMI
jgi:hypothetical protein